ncbi:spore coat U domain-containing protein [soil metagenome]
MRQSVLRHISRAVFLLAASVSTASPAYAGSTSGTIAVSLNVSAACAVNGGSITSGALGQIGAIAFADQPGIFGNVDAAMVPTSGSGGLSVLCSPGLAPALTIGAGAHDSGSLRQLTSGSNNVPYRLYSDAGRTTEITIGQQISLGTATTTAFSIPIYARVNSGGNVLAAGAYADTVQVTLSW